LITLTFLLAVLLTPAAAPRGKISGKLLAAVLEEVAAIVFQRLQLVAAPLLAIQVKAPLSF